MRSEGVVDVRSPLVDIVLEMIQAISSDVWPDLLLEGSMEAFDLALCLRMIGSSVKGLDVEADEAAFEPAERFRGLVQASEAVVGEDLLRACRRRP